MISGRGGRLHCLLVGAALGAALLATTKAAAQVADKVPYLVGSTNQLTGTTAVVGRPYVAGATTYFKWRNDHGGIGGHPVKLTALDDQSNPDLGVANTKKLLGDGNIVLLAPVLSAVGIPMLPVVGEAKVPVVAYTGVEQMESHPYYYAIGLDGTHSFQIIADYLKTRATAPSRVAFFQVESPASTAAREATAKRLQKWGWQVVDVETFASRATEFNAQVLKIADSKPDFIISGLDDGKSPVALPALQRAGVKAPVVNFQSGNAEASFRTIASDQFLAVREYMDPSEPDPATQPMREAAAKYGATADMTSNVFTKGWVAASLIATALESCGDHCTGEAVKTAIDGMASFETMGLGPRIAFSATKKLGVTQGRIYQWSAEKGRAVPITGFVGPTE
jgi:branched-chain amino acid transport system substrate-binding protein